jgi:hypothetical protein
MAGRNGIFWYHDTLSPRSAAFSVVMEETLEEIVEQVAQEVQDYAQTNAPWTDQTGDAREGLTAESFSESNVLTIVLYHTVEYGIWLEVRNSGEYAIIIPTIEQMGPVVMGAVSTLFTVAP